MDTNFFLTNLCWFINYEKNVPILAFGNSSNHINFVSFNSKTNHSYSETSKLAAVCTSPPSNAEIVTTMLSPHSKCITSAKTSSESIVLNGINSTDGNPHPCALPKPHAKEL